MTDSQLRELEAICERATPGKWGTFQCTPFDSLLVNAPGRNVCALPGWNHRPDEREADAHFIATARTALPAALAEIRRLKAALREACNLGLSAENPKATGAECVAYYERLHALSKEAES